MTKRKISNLETGFERFSENFLQAIGSPLAFIAALLLVIFWMSGADYSKKNLHDILRDVILGITFLSFFLIQKTVNKFSKALHLKLNELVSAHENANDEIMNIEEKTEQELADLAKTYSEKKNKNS